MENMFIPFELAEKLKDQGYTDKTLKYYNSEHKLIDNHAEGAIAAPTFQEVNDWLRELYFIHIYIKLVRSNNRFLFFVEHEKGIEHGIPHDTFYKAWEKAIYKALSVLN
jgi:hypothetical protein